MFLWKRQRVRDRNALTWGALGRLTFGSMPNALTTRAIRAKHLLSHVLTTGSGGADIFAAMLTFEMEGRMVGITKFGIVYNYHLPKRIIFVLYFVDFPIVGVIVT